MMKRPKLVKNFQGDEYFQEKQQHIGITIVRNFQVTH